MVNAISFEVAETLVSHVTGTVSKARCWGVRAGLVPSTLWRLVAFFLVGSIVCGCIIRRSAVKMACMGYGVAMTSSGFILVFATFMFSVSQDAAVYSLCFACGLQNGIMSSYTGSVVRTTHVTGIATDIGLITGRHIMSFFRRRLCKRLTFADEEPGEERPDLGYEPKGVYHTLVEMRDLLASTLLRSEYVIVLLPSIENSVIACFG
ncbi:unnamed protein product [Effrenium voratum]|uniref:Uncharacterized protein n=1 Tax=Effrenium voratum TaxID=2562239 RepID=A0AA36JHE9_9DINO|nr:unnamed protein product [Effrenium voratum]CAJ1417331.1 unnamed protein product [Effrenium voratum]